MALTTNLVSYWKLDESSGNAADSVASNTLTNTGVTYSAGKINNGGVFQSADLTDILSITDAAQSGLDIAGDIAISMWLKPASNPANNGNEFTLLQKNDTAANLSYSFRYSQISGSLQLRMRASSDGSASQAASVVTDLGTGTFKHVVMSWKASTSTLTVYVNGASINTGTTTGITALFNGTSPFQIGNGNPGAYDGMIDEVGIWSRELTGAEVTSLYNGGAGFQYPFTVSSSNWSIAYV